MEGLAVFIGSCINWVIAGLAVLTIGGFAYTVLQVGKLQNQIDDHNRHS